jgi:hypothetical protein
MIMLSTLAMLFTVAIVIAFWFFCVYLFKIAWNSSLTKVTSLNEITYWQSFGVMFLIAIAGRLFNMFTVVYNN